MRYQALACDYDGTIAQDGRVHQETIQAFEDVKKSGRKLILVTGRELEDLMGVFPRLDLFDRVVAENGAVIYRPASREERILAERPPEPFVAELARRGVDPVSVGRVIVATWRPHETTVLEVIRDFGLELQVIFNKGAVMVLPSGVNKATGLAAALEELGLSAHNVVGVGDAENDHAFLALCECSVAVQNALDTLKQRVDWVTAGDHGKGAVELMRALVDADLGSIADRPGRRLVLGKRADGAEVWLHPYGNNVLISGASGAGKSTLAASFLERLEERDYQYAIIDPEGDYSAVPGAVALGGNEQPPDAEEALEVLANPAENAVVNLIGIELTDRPRFFETLFGRIQGLRANTGRPHWIIIDEAHHVLPPSWAAAEVTAPQRLFSLMLITITPEKVTRAVLSAVDVVIAVGSDPQAAFQRFADAAGEIAPSVDAAELKQGDAAIWFRRSAESPSVFQAAAPKAERRRHQRKYAEGELHPDLCFYFRGPEGKLNLKAQNLAMFLQIADGVDDETWQFHMRNGDISKWFRDMIKDPDLAVATEEIACASTTPQESRRRVRDEIERRYIIAA